MSPVLSLPVAEAPIRSVVEWTANRLERVFKALI
jgi:hypothetical protein